MESQAQHLSRATQAAMDVAQVLGIERFKPVVLHHSQHVTIRFFPLDVVARVISVKDAAAVEALHRELVVAQHLVEKRAPIVPPTTDLPAGPHFSGEFALTLWQFVEHSAADGDNKKHVAQAANALRLIHQALADFPGELPTFKVKIEKCRSLLERERFA